MPAAVFFSKSATKQPSTTAVGPFADGFDAPMDIANCGDSRLFVAERLGKIWILDSSGKVAGTISRHHR